MFYSATPNEGARKIDALDHAGDPAYWIVVPIAPDFELHFKLLNAESSPFERIISALTQSAVVHVETWCSGTNDFAESKIGEPYDFVGCLRAWDDSGYHTPDKEFCSGFATEIIKPVLPGLFQYPNPGKLLMDVSAMLNKPIPKMAALPKGLIGENEQDYLQSLVPEQLATGDMQRVQQALEAIGQA